MGKAQTAEIQRGIFFNIFASLLVFVHPTQQLS